MDERELEALKALYAAELNYLDYWIGRLYDLLEERGILDDILLIIIGENSEEFGDGLMDHQYCLYDILLYVPLIVQYPHAFEAGHETDALVELRDLYPTILDLAEIDQSDPVPASDRSLLDVDGRSPVVGEYLLDAQQSMSALKDRVRELTPELRQYDRTLRSVRTHKWTYIEGTDCSHRLYDRIEDPDETTNLTDRHPIVCEDLATVLHDRLGI